MDFDAIIIFKQILNKAHEITENDKLLMISAINNKSIDINLSIRDNLTVVRDSDITLEELKTYLYEFLINNEEYLNTPIYLLLLENMDLWNLLLLAHKNKTFSDKSLLDCVEILFSYMIIADDNEYIKIATFLNDMLSVRRNINIDLFQNSSIIQAFVTSNYDSLSYSYSENDFESHRNFSNRLLILKLLSFGYINFHFAEVYDSNIDGVYEIVSPLLNKQSYTHLKLIINSKSTNYEDAMRLKELITNHLNTQEFNTIESLIKLENFIKDYNNRIILINPNATIDRSLKKILK